MTPGTAVRWILTPITTFLALIATYVLLSTIGGALHGLVGTDTMNALMRPDLRTGVVGALVACGTVWSGSLVAPARRTVVAIALYAAGAWLAVRALDGWSFPEHHPRAYQESIVPLVLTLIGGLLAVVVVARAQVFRPKLRRGTAT